LIKGRIKVENNGKIGFINESGKELVPIKYDQIEGFGTLTKNFSDDLVVVKNNGKVGLIDFEDGQLVIPVMYNEIFNFQALSDNSYKIAKVNKNGKFGFINMNGEEIISPIYDEIKDFNNGYASFRVNNRWGLINSLGKETINASYDDPLYFNGNETYVTLNGAKVKIDRFGKQIKETPVKDGNYLEQKTLPTKEYTVNDFAAIGKHKVKCFLCDKGFYRKDGFVGTHKDMCIKDFKDAVLDVIIASKVSKWAENVMLEILTHGDYFCSRRCIDASGNCFSIF